MLRIRIEHTHRLDEGQVEHFSQMFRSLLGRLQTMESRIMRTLDEVLDNVRAAHGQVTSLVQLTNGLRQQVRDALAGKLSPSDQAKVDAIFDEVETAKNDVIAAINANTDPAQDGGVTGQQT